MQVQFGAEMEIWVLHFEFEYCTFSVEITYCNADTTEHKQVSELWWLLHAAEVGWWWGYPPPLFKKLCRDDSLKISKEEEKQERKIKKMTENQEMQ